MTVYLELLGFHHGAMFLVKRNSTSIDSINIYNSQCSYKSSEEIEFESNTLSLDKRSITSVNIPFTGINKSEIMFSGSTKGPFLEFEVNVIE